MSLPELSVAGLSRGMLGLVLLAGATCLLYWPGLQGPFLFDDAPNIVDNLALETYRNSFLDWWSAALSSHAGVLRRPIPMLSFALQFELLGAHSAFALKLVNLLIHCVCGGLVYLLATLLLGGMGARVSPRERKWLPLLAAALWTLNPLLVSTVLYPVQRMAQFSALFMLAGLCCYAYYRSRWACRGASVDEMLALPLWLGIFTLLAAFSKENGVLLPGLVAVLEVTLFRGRWAGAYRAGVARVAVLLFLLPVLATASFLLLQWDWVIAGYAVRDFSFAERVWTELRLLWSYVGWFSLPRSGALGLFHDDVIVSKGWLQPLTTVLAGMAWLGVLAAGFALRRSFPWLLMAALFFLGGHSLESGFLALELVFEHRNYLPSVALALLLAAALLRASDFLASRGRSFLGGLAPLLLLLMFALVLGLRSLNWSSEWLLASASYARHPDSPRSAHFYANTLMKEHSAVGERESGRANMLALARHEFEVLHQRNPADLSALVMLYTLDSRYFPEVADPDRWFAGIERSVASSKMLATEYAAMRVLLACVEAAACRVDESRLRRLVELFYERYPYKSAAAELQLGRLESAQAPAEERVALINAALERSQGGLGLRYQLVAAYLEQRDFVSAHGVIVELLAGDPLYRQLAGIDGLFHRAPVPGAD